MTTPVLFATHEQVVTAWLKSFLAIPVATTLPDGQSWSGTGFVTVMPVGGTSNADMPMRRPVVSIDAWANNPESNKPAWGRANTIAEQIYAATYDPALALRTLTVAGHQVRIFNAYPISEPLRVPDDGAGYAHYVFNLELSWVAL